MHWTWEQTKDHYGDRLWVYAFHTAKDYPATGRSWYFVSPSEENNIHNQLLMDRLVLCLFWWTSFLETQGFKTFLLCSKPTYSAAQLPYPFGWHTAVPISCLKLKFHLEISSFSYILYVRECWPFFQTRNIWVPMDSYFSLTLQFYNHPLPILSAS